MIKTKAYLDKYHLSMIGQHTMTYSMVSIDGVVNCQPLERFDLINYEVNK